MAATISVVDPGGEGSGDEKLVSFDFTPDVSPGYPTGGWPISGLGGPIQAVLGALKGYLAVWDQPAQKLMLYRQTAVTGALAEVPNGTDLSALGSVRLIAVVGGS